MTTAQSAAYLGMSDRHVRKLIADGSIPAERQDTPRGPIWWLKRNDLDQFREKRAQATEGEVKRGPGRPPKVPRAPGEGGSVS